MEEYITIIKYNNGDGRVTIPRELRKKLKLNFVSELSLSVKNNKIILEPEIKRCFGCGAVENLDYQVGDEFICKDCYKKITKKDGNK